MPSGTACVAPNVTTDVSSGGFTLVEKKTPTETNLESSHAIDDGWDKIDKDTDTDWEDLGQDADAASNRIAIASEPNAQVVPTEPKGTSPRDQGLVIDTAAGPKAPDISLHNAADAQNSAIAPAPILSAAPPRTTAIVRKSALERDGLPDSMRRHALERLLKQTTDPEEKASLQARVDKINAKKARKAAAATVPDAKPEQDVAPTQPAEPAVAKPETQNTDRLRRPQPNNGMPAKLRRHHGAAPANASDASNWQKKVSKPQEEQGRKL